jgi:hypothetical protein
VVLLVLRLERVQAEVSPEVDLEGDLSRRRVAVTATVELLATATGKSQGSGKACGDQRHASLGEPFHYSSTQESAVLVY